MNSADSGSGQPRIIMTRMAHDSILKHAYTEAKASGVEVLGWLVGFFVEDAVYVASAHPCTKYTFQSRVGAAADPREEYELAFGYPRSIGIVGLYHSHPFRDDYHHHGEFRKITSHEDMFHSHTDDDTLKTRSSTRKNQLSVVTDGVSLDCFTMSGGESKPIPPELVDSIEHGRHMTEFRSEIDLSTEAEFDSENLLRAIRDLEDHIIGQVEKHICPGGIKLETEGSFCRVKLPGLERGPAGGGVGKSRIQITPSKGKFKANIQLRLSPTIYVNDLDPDLVINTLRNEINDDIAFLLWDSIDYKRFKGYLWSDLESVTLHLGRVSVKEPFGQLPRKSYTKPKRKMDLRRKH